MSDVVLFPPLPPIPQPPASEPDERQQTFRSIIGNLTSQLGTPVAGSGVAPIDRNAGYRASAVDLGRLQEVLGEGIARFDMAMVRERWNVDVQAWMFRAIRMWTQRCKAMHLELADNGIAVRLDTQDDRGYYEYSFDVFPGRR
jgi:hypothetical protein